MYDICQVERLTFAVTGGEVRNIGDWFKLQQLVAAHPWSLQQMKSDSYADFTMPNLNGDRCPRIFKSYAGCNTEKAYLVISSATACMYDARGTSLKYAYSWNPDPNQPIGITVKKEPEARVVVDFDLGAEDRVYEYKLTC